MDKLGKKRFAGIAAVTMMGIATWQLYGKWANGQTYPASIRKPLKYALTIKHKQQKRSKEEVENAIFAFREALKESKNCNDISTCSMAHVGILVELGDFYRDIVDDDGGDHWGDKWKQAGLAYSEALSAHLANIPSPNKSSISTLKLDNAHDTMDDKDVLNLPMYLQAGMKPEQECIKYASGISTRLAEVYVETGQLDKAEQVYNWTLESLIASSIIIYPTRHDISSIHYTSSTTTSPQIQMYEQMKNVVNEMGYCVEGLAGVLLKQGRLDDALRAYQGLLTVLVDSEKKFQSRDNCKTAHVLNSIADILYAKNQKKEALKVLNNAMEWVDLSYRWMNMIPFDFEDKLFCRECKVAIGDNISFISQERDQRRKKEI